MAILEKARAGDRLSFGAGARGRPSRVHGRGRNRPSASKVALLLAGLAGKISGKLRKEARLLLERK